MLESKIHALEELLAVSETSFLAEAQKLEHANKQLREEINEHERLNKKLQESEEEFRALFESSRDAIMLLDQNTFFDCNKATLDLFGFSSKEQFILRTPSDLSPPTQPDGEDSLTAALKQIEKAYRDGTNFFEWLHARQDGTPFYAEVLLSRMEYQGKMVLQATVRDITKRKQAEEDLTFRNILLATQQETSIDGILVVNENNTIISYNRRFIEIMGIPDELIENKSDEPVLRFVMELMAAPQQFMQRVQYLYEHRRETGNEELALKDGRILDRYSSPMFGADERYYGRVWYFRDITDRKRAEEALCRERDFNQTLVQSSGVFFVAIRPDGRVVLMNDCMLNALGYTLNEVTGTEYMTFVRADEREALTKIFGQLTVSNQSTLNENRVLAKDGRELLVEWHGKSIFKGAELDYFFGVGIDITERRRAENALAGEELRRRILMEQSRDGIVVLTDDGKVFEANKRYADTLGYTAAETLQLHVWDWDTQWTREQLLEMLRKTDAAGNLLETQHRRKDGSFYDVEVSSNGAVIEGRKLIFCVCRDITARKRAEEEIRHISAIQKLILENSTLGIALVRNRVFEWVNARVGELLMLPIEQIQGASTRVIYPSDESCEKMGEISYPVLARGERSVNTCQLKRSDESLFWCRFIGKALNPAKIHDGSVWMFEDITEEKLARTLVEESAQKQGRIEMANNMLHDIGNALTGVSSCMTGPQLEKNWPEIKLLRQLQDLFASVEKELTGLLGETKEKALVGLIEALTSSLQKRNTNNLEFCEKISNAVGHICAVLDLQRYYLREKSAPLATTFDLKKIIEDALTILASSLQKRNIEVKISAAGIKTLVSGDQTRIMRLFLNIIKNIYEAFDDLEPSPDRKLEINIISDIEKQETTIAFKDNGIGFSPETGGKLFERGFTTKRTGSGIGLHECLAIVESHGGTIAIESNGENTGACTIIKLPFPGNQKG